jgi:hypothetical protein
MKDRQDKLTTDLLSWLLEPDNPSVRFVALRYLLDRPLTDPGVRGAQAAIIGYRPVQAILGKMSAPHYWDDLDDERVRMLSVWVCLLAELRADSNHPLVRKACESVFEKMQQEDGAFPSKHPGYSGLRPCTQGLVSEALLRLGFYPDPRLERAVESATSMGYECVYNAGLPCAWGVVKLLRMMAAIPPRQRGSAVNPAIGRGVDLLLSYDLAQANYPCSEGISLEWFKLGFPRGFQSDILETLETLACLGCAPAPRLEAAMNWVLSKQKPDGRWCSEFVSPQAQELGIDRVGKPSKWITLRALRVLKWWGA